MSRLLALLASLLRHMYNNRIHTKVFEMIRHTDKVLEALPMTPEEQQQFVRDWNHAMTSAAIKNLTSDPALDYLKITRQSVNEALRDGQRRGDDR
jgi:hypothetical protein